MAAIIDGNTVKALARGVGIELDTEKAERLVDCIDRQILGFSVLDGVCDEYPPAFAAIDGGAVFEAERKKG